MPVPVLIPAVAVLTCVAWVRAKPKQVTVGMSAERMQVYEACLKSLKDPVALRKMADSFQGEGLKDQADLLRKRAALRELPPEISKARREAFRKGMQSKNKSAVLQLAASFEKEGATGAALNLRKYASGL